MKYLFSALYVIGVAIILLNLSQIFIEGWSWPPVVRTVIALCFLYTNYRFQKEAFRTRKEREHKKK